MQPGCKSKLQNLKCLFGTDSKQNGRQASPLDISGNNSHKAYLYKNYEAL